MRRWGMGGLAGLLAVLVGAMALSPVAAFGSAPANDLFAERQSLGSDLPLDVSGSNVGATRETGEPFTPFGAGHSVWFEWQAPSTELVTVGTCGSDIGTVYAVYTGSGFPLTEVANESTFQPQQCPAGVLGGLTFKASAGTKYELLVDGDPFFVPPAAPPATEGAIKLQIEATPSPANDDFADAGVLTGTTDAEGIYFAHARGFNWNATKETGEPNHKGDLGGASVWYSWAAPASGKARISLFGDGSPGLIGVYAGSSVDALTAVAPTQDPPAGSTFPVSGGTTYRIAVDGTFNAVSGEPKMSRFDLGVFMQLSAAPVESPPRAGSPPPPASPSDSTPPDTTIGKPRHGSSTASFTFKASEVGSSFRCRLDQHRFTACSSPKAYKDLKPGRHTFRVFAVDAAGNSDPTPAVTQFAVPKPGDRGRRVH